MKRFFLTCLLVCATGILIFARTMNDERQLSALWAQYEAALKADLPQKEAALLLQIEQEATKKHLAADFYDAATTYVETVRRRDWKQQAALREHLTEAVKAFDEPIVTFSWMREWNNAPADTLWAYVQAHPEGFDGCHRAFHKAVSRYLNGALAPFIQNDREYVLWLLRKDECLAEAVAGRYPNEAALAYHQLLERDWEEEDRTEEKNAFEALARRYAGQAVALYPQAEVLRIRFEELTRNNAPEADWKALRDDARRTEAARKACKGDEARVAEGCTYPEQLLRGLESSALGVRVKDGAIVVWLKNLSSAEVRLLEGKQKRGKWTLQNAAKRFYVPDTLRIPLPALPDGTYTVEAESGKYADEALYEQYSLSIAVRSDAGGPAVYVADYDSGVPLRSTTLRLLKGDKEVARTSLKLDGFTPLPSAFAQCLAAHPRTYYSIEAQSESRKSHPVALRTQIVSDGTTAREQLRCHFFRDKGAYNPGDTLRFKAIVFKGDPTRALKAEAGKTVEIGLYDSEGNLLGSVKAVTNAFGSVAGSFSLPTGLRNGYYRLEMSGVGSDGFRVDEFVLPSFDLAFDPADQLCFPGDEMPVSGRLISYSGHPMSGVKLRARVTRYGDSVREETLSVDADNRFQFRFPLERAGYYAVELTATAPDGETRRFNQFFYVGDALSVDATFPEAADAELHLAEKEYRSRYTLQSREVRMVLQARDQSGRDVPLPVRYRLLGPDGRELFSGESPSGERCELSLPGSGLYTLKAEVSARKADGTEVKADKEIRLLLQLPGERSLSAAVRRLFVAGPSVLPSGTPLTARIGSAEGDAYAVVTLYGKNRQPLHTERLRVADGSVETLSFAYRDSWPDAVRLQIFYFIHGEAVTYDREFRREKDRYHLPLRFSRFQDKAFPGATYRFSLETAPDAEVLAAAWDKSIDAVAPNVWPLVQSRDVSVEGVYVSAVCGGVGSPSPIFPLTRAMSSRKASPESAMVMNATVDYAADLCVEEDAILAKKTSAAGAAFGEEVRLREHFAAALSFQPQLRPKADGTLDFEVKTSDKLSTFYVRAYAHDAQMRNARAEGEMVVSLPVKVSLLEPRFLYAGDVYDAMVTLSNSVSEAVSGVLTLQAGEQRQQFPLSVPAGGTVSQTFRVSPETCGDWVLTAQFKADAFSDAVRVTVPVFPAAQQLTEAHSAVLHAGADRAALIEDLRGRFVNVPGEQARLQEISVLQMLRDAIPAHADPAGNDVLSLSEAWYVRLMAARTGQPLPGDTAELLEKILACRNADGGFGWFEGMTSSPVITAVLLERFAKLRERGFAVPETAASVRYLDKVCFDGERPVWCGGLSDAQYLYLRSFYPEVPFAVDPATQAGKKRLAQFRKEAKRYLTPTAKDGRGLQGRILEKARRLLTLRRLSASADGKALARAWGIRFSASLEKSRKADLASLTEYAVEHRDGGWYYPNAVMPWRGLLESEAYAHALLCDLLSDEGVPLIADGIRLWLMLQKETQHWESEPAFIDAITAVLDGSDAVLSTRVLALSATYEAPFPEIRSAGNGFSVERAFFRERDGEWIPLQEGDSLSVGERVTVEYAVWNAENRSFVRLEAGREASLQPVQQLSGPVGYGFVRPFRGGLDFGFVPQGYRNVKARCTEYYFDSYPEENTRLSEQFYVVRAGVFQAPAVTIASLYAPHYRANSAAPSPLSSR